MPPGIRKRLPEACQCGEEARKEYRTTTTEPVIKWDGEPAADEGATEIRGRVDQSQEPGRSRIFPTNSKLLTVKELRTVNNSFICNLVSE
jgi:hypothetical protein